MLFRTDDFSKGIKMNYLLELLAFAKFHPELIVAIVAIFIALLTYLDSRQNRRLSARPCLQIIREFDVTKDFIGITLANHSSAVGIIGDIFVKVDDFKIINDKITYLDDAILKLKFIGQHNVSLRHMNKGSFIAPGKEIWIIKMFTKELSSEQLKTVLFELDRIQINVCYQSIYKIKYNADTGNKMFKTYEDVLKSIYPT